LDALSPLAVLQRGYAIAQDADGKLLRDAAAVQVGDEVGVRLAKGRFSAKVSKVSEEP
jgi:exodeoxyribonuclease VII large subunit